MTRRQPEPLGVAIVTAWIELGPPEVLKIRVSTRVDASRHRYATKDPAAAGDYVREWLEGFRAGISTANDEKAAGAETEPKSSEASDRRLVS